jgi:hypothetical protein
MFPPAPGIADRKLPFDSKLRAVATLVKEAIAARGRSEFRPKLSLVRGAVAVAV